MIGIWLLFIAGEAYGGMAPPRCNKTDGSFQKLRKEASRTLRQKTIMHTGPGIQTLLLNLNKIYHVGVGNFLWGKSACCEEGHGGCLTC